MTKPTPKLDIPGNLRDVVLTTFTYSCPYGCTVQVTDGEEEPHDCAGAAQVEKTLRDALGVGYGPVAAVVADELRPLLRDRSFELWQDGVISGRRSLCCGVDDDVPDGGVGVGVESLTPEGHIDDVTCPCGPLVHPVAGLMHTLTAGCTGADLIAAERCRQIDVEGYTPDHDLMDHKPGALTRAAACYLMPHALRPLDRPPVSWPFRRSDFKPTPENRVRELVKAGALIAAEIDRLNAQADGPR